jgi:signal transduction histidine kinase
MHLVLETEQRRALEGALADMIVRQDELMSTKAEFLANVSHELRTPVTVAKGIAFVLKHEGIAAEEQHEFLVQLDASLDKLMMLVDEMLTIAELDRGALELEPTETDLAPLLHREADEIGRCYPAIPIERTIPEDLIASVDPLRFPEIVRQLLDNACRFSAEGSPVLLRARTMSEGIVVSVTDRGSGLERRVALQAFAEPFSAGEEILRKERAGVGIGLYMARQLVLQHGGIMWSDPLPAGGTRIAFCLPERPGETVTRRPRISADGEPDASRSAAGSTYRASTTTSS